MPSFVATQIVPSRSTAMSEMLSLVSFLWEAVEKVTIWSSLLSNGVPPTSKSTNPNSFVPNHIKPELSAVTTIPSPVGSPSSDGVNHCLWDAGKSLITTNGVTGGGSSDSAA